MIIEYEVSLAECDSLQKIYYLKEVQLKNQLRVADSVASNLQGQVNAAMGMNEVCGDQKKLLKTEYDNLQKDYEKQIKKNNNQKKGISWLIGTGIAALCGVLGVSIYAGVK